MGNQQISYQDNTFYVIPNEPDFSITTEGTVKKIKNSKVLKPFIDKDGYHRVTLCRQGTTKKYYVHRLVALTFIGQPPADDSQVNHKNSIRYFNHYTNLEWCSPKENTQHGITQGNLIVKGEDCPRASLSNESVLHICELLNKGVPVVNISKDLGIPVGTVFSIKSKQTWSHLTTGILKVEVSEKLTKERAEEICVLLSEGKTDKQILNIVQGVNRHHVGNIRLRKTFKSVSKNYSW